MLVPRVLLNRGTHGSASFFFAEPFYRTFLSMSGLLDPQIAEILLLVLILFWLCSQATGLLTGYEHFSFFLGIKFLGWVLVQCSSTLRGLRKQRLVHLHDAVACVRDIEKPRHGSVLHRENPLFFVTSPTSRARCAACAPVRDGPSCSANDEK